MEYPIDEKLEQDERLGEMKGEATASFKARNSDSTP